MDFLWYQEALGHFSTGVALSLADRAFSKDAKRYSQVRLESKLDQAEAMDYLVKSSQSEDLAKICSSQEYFDAVSKTRQYFKSKKVNTEPEQDSNGRLKSIADKLAFYRNNSKINNTSSGELLAYSFGLELAGDACVGIAQTVYGLGNGLVALGESLYQGPALFLGVLTGKGLLYTKDLVTKSNNEKEADSLLTELTKDGKLLELVRNYSPTKSIPKSIPSSKDPAVVVLRDEEVSSASSNQDMYETFVSKAKDLYASSKEIFGERVTEGISSIRNSISESKTAKKQAIEARKTALRKKYDKY